jgi:spore germination protein GerM
VGSFLGRPCRANRSGAFLRGWEPIRPDGKKAHHAASLFHLKDSKAGLIKISASHRMMPYFQNILASAVSKFSEGAHVNSTLKIQNPEAVTLLEKIKIELKKRAEAKAKRMLFKRPKRLAKRFG